MPIALAHDTITRDDVEALSTWVLETDRFTKGPLTETFEIEFAKYVDSKYAIFVNSGSSANLIAASALMYAGRTPRRKVIVPAVSWVTTVTPFMQLGYDVHVCDCDTKSLGLDLDQLERLLDETSADVVILVHVLGHNSEVEIVRKMCVAHGASLVEDTCEAIGSKTSAKALGTFGEFGTYSFYYGHHISTIEGGMVVTDDYELAQIARSLRAHGWARDLDSKFRDNLELINDIDRFQSLYTFYYPGFNCRPTDLNAFLGLRQLEKLDTIVRVREKNFGVYADCLPEFWRQSSNTATLSSFAYGTLVENRLELAAALAGKGIESRPLICGSIARQPFLQGRFKSENLSKSDVIHRHGIYFPNHLSITSDDIEKVASEVRKIGRPIEGF